MTRTLRTLTLMVFPEYGAADLYAFLKNWGVAKPRWAAFSYSNVGFGLLGQALANRAGVGYVDLVRGITEPLGMRDTVVNLSPRQRERLIQGRCIMFEASIWCHWNFGTPLV
jgi:D-alanyl-D-alanine-carboxypeptidase/D-alanyl-D-alanine-endopeptidase